MIFYVLVKTMSRGKKDKGTLTQNSRNYVPGLITWNFSYKADLPRVKKLDKGDVEGVYGRNQIKIRQNSVLMICLEKCQGIRFQLHYLQE